MNKRHAAPPRNLLMRVCFALVMLSSFSLSWPSLGRITRVSVAADVPPKSMSCDLCADNWLFVLGAEGRTGTTTTMFTLRAVPGIELAGEHNGVLNEARVIYERLVALPRHVSAFSSPELDHDAFACTIQELVKNMIFGKERSEREPLTRILGFKEIRYATRSPDMLLFLLDMFPCARFIFSVRNNADVINLAEKEFGKHARKRWVYGRELVNLTHAAFPERTMIFPVEELTLDLYNRALNSLLKVTGCHFRAIDARNLRGQYSHEAPKQNQRKSRLLEGECDLSLVDFRESATRLARQKLSVIPELAERLKAVPHWETT
ncbi:hypothetical protein FVE85_7448 [Porphyridium purpureum]|uniref:Protein-tyrosine sulfotransferase n=1 Tax=Porphyridium purpureum TaxID=35688 RepID=A0A5J4ZAU6_PORPP|nr:hypothetical protein FVE85_7448 [Porphyridium purpureum]|eukprot:POR3914..scf295_1